MQDHYAALGLSSAASLADVKKAFRLRASQYHPDRNVSPNAPQLFRAVQTAYEVLSDNDRRKTYDDNRRRGLLDDPLDTATEIWHTYLNQALQ